VELIHVQLSYKVLRIRYFLLRRFFPLLLLLQNSTVLTNKQTLYLAATNRQHQGHVLQRQLHRYYRIAFQRIWNGEGSFQI
jgi:hypothetical protein